MSSTLNFDLVRATVAELQRSARPATRPADTPVTPGRVTVWGPRASRRADAVVVHLPAPRAPMAAEVADAAEAVLLDA